MRSNTTKTTNVQQKIMKPTCPNNGGKRLQDMQQQQQSKQEKNFLKQKQPKKQQQQQKNQQQHQHQQHQSCIKNKTEREDVVGNKEQEAVATEMARKEKEEEEVLHQKVARKEGIHRNVAPKGGLHQNVEPKLVKNVRPNVGKRTTQARGKKMTPPKMKEQTQAEEDKRGPPQTTAETEAKLSKSKSLNTAIETPRETEIVGTVIDTVTGEESKKIKRGQTPKKDRTVLKPYTRPRKHPRGHWSEKTYGELTSCDESSSSGSCDSDSTPEMNSSFSFHDEEPESPEQPKSPAEPKSPITVDIDVLLRQKANELEKKLEANEPEKNLEAERHIPIVSSTGKAAPSYKPSKEAAVRYTFSLSEVEGKEEGPADLFATPPMTEIMFDMSAKGNSAVKKISTGITAQEEGLLEAYEQINPYPYLTKVHQIPGANKR